MDGPPRIVLDASALLGELTGVGIYARELLPPLARLVEATLFLSALKGEIPAWVSKAGGPGASARVVRSRWPARGLLLSWHHLRRPHLETLLPGSFDLAHSLNYSVMPTRRPLVVTLHDLYFLRDPKAGTRFGGRFFAQDLKRHAHRVAHFIAVSEQTCRDAQELLGVDRSRISIVLEAPRTDFLGPASPEEQQLARRRLDLPETYLLCYGNDDPRKNRAGLEEAYARLLGRMPDAPPLVVVGGAPLDALPHVPILWRPYLPPHELRATLSRALALVFPSFYEGFGLPVVEALALGVPVAASATGAIPEVAGNCFVELDPSDSEQMADALARVCQDSDLRQRLAQEGPRRTAGLSWERAARETFSVYRAVLGR